MEASRAPNASPPATEDKGAETRSRPLGPTPGPVEASRKPGASLPATVSKSAETRSRLPRPTARPAEASRKPGASSPATARVGAETRSPPLRPTAGPAETDQDYKDDETVITGNLSSAKINTDEGTTTTSPDTDDEWQEDITSQQIQLRSQPPKPPSPADRYRAMASSILRRSRGKRKRIDRPKRHRVFLSLPQTRESSRKAALPNSDVIVRDAIVQARQAEDWQDPPSKS